MSTNWKGGLATRNIHSKIGKDETDSKIFIDTQWPLRSIIISYKLTTHNVMSYFYVIMLCHNVMS